MGEFSEGTNISSVGSSRSERGEKLYRGMEQKIQILKGIWDQAKGFSIPSLNDSNSANQEVQDDFKDIFENVPVGLQNDKQFADFLLVGTKAATEKRKQIRTTLSQARSMGQDDFDTLLPDKLKFFKGKIIKGLPGNFSITLVVDDDSLTEYSKRFPASSHIRAFHEKGTIWNLQQEHPYNISLDLPHTRQKKSFDETLLHEDFHSFMECFPVDETSSDYLWGLVGLRLDQLQNAKLQGDQVTIQDKIRAAKSAITRFVDIDHEELLASLASVNDRWNIGYFFGALQLEKARDLKTIEGLDPAVDSIIKNLRWVLDGNQLKNTLNGWYQEVGRKAPERMTDLDIALALFSPSQFKNVGRLVERWTKGREEDINSPFYYP